MVFGCTSTTTTTTTNSPNGNGSGGSGDISSINHIIIVFQENRGFDHYFGAMRQYWAQNGYADESFDGLPQFNPASGTAPLQGAPPSIPGCDPSSPAPGPCNPDANNPVTSFHLQTMCMENPSPSWDEAHNDWGIHDPTGNSPATMNGFVWTAAYDARALNYFDTAGTRAMGYYDGNDLNYYYFMASNFATSDRWFHPAMTRTGPNREYLDAGTSQGYAFPNTTDPADMANLTAKTIWEELQDAGITWKIYVNTLDSGCTGPPYDPSCLITLSYLRYFNFGQTVVQKYSQNIAPITQYFTDLQNGTLPQVVDIEPASAGNLDEHPSGLDTTFANVQTGAQYVSTLIDGLMQSTSWKDSALIFSFDEGGGFYDHVPSQPTVSPDGIKPVDLSPGDVCTTSTGPTCDFVYTGYRVPLIVISPYAKKHYVSHTVMDYTAVDKLIETRFNVPALTKRDSAQPDMSEFFDFSNPPWTTPPNPPAQNTTGPCYLDHLP